MKPHTIKVKMTKLANDIVDKIANFKYAQSYMPRRHKVEEFACHQIKRYTDDRDLSKEYYDYGMNSFKKEYKSALEKYPEYKEFTLQEHQRLAMQHANIKTVEKFLNNTNNKRTRQFLLQELIDSKQLEKVKLFERELTVNNVIPLLYNPKNEDILNYMLGLESIHKNIDGLLYTAVRGNSPYSELLVDYGASVFRLEQNLTLTKEFDAIKNYELSSKRKEMLESSLETKGEIKRVKI